MGEKTTHTVNKHAWSST